MTENTARIHNLGFGFLGHHPVEELTELVRTAEELGFTSAWIAEDYFYAGAFSLAGSILCFSKDRAFAGVFFPERFF